MDRTQSSITTLGGYQEDDDGKLEAHLKALTSKVDNDVHDVMHMLREKYINFLLQSMYLDVNFSIEQAIVKAKAALTEIQGYVDEAEGGKQSKLPKDKENAPPSLARQKMDYINNVISKLSIIQKIEKILPNVKSDETRTVAAAIVEVDQLFKDLERTEYYEPLNKVVAGIYSSYAIHKGQTMTYLINKFHEMIQCSKPLDGQFFQLVVSREDIPSFNHDLEAMQILGILDSHLVQIVERLLTGMFPRILDSTADAEHVFVIESLADQYVAALRDEIFKAEKKDPVQIFQSLTVFFEFLHKALKKYFVVETPLIEMIGKMMAPNLVEMLVKDLLAACVESVNTRLEDYQPVIDAAKKFDDLLQELNFFEKEVSTFESCFISKFEKINVTRRCLKIFISAKECIADVSGDVVNVGTTLEESDNSSILYFEELKNSQFLSEDDYTKNEVLPKSLQFPVCKVPKAIRRLGDLFISTIQTAASCETEHATERFLSTARNIITLFIMTYEKTHHDKIEADPLFAQMYVNQCHFLSHVLFMASLRLTPLIFNKFPSLEKECDLASMFSQLHQKKSPNTA